MESLKNFISVEDAPPQEHTFYWLYAPEYDITPFVGWYEKGDFYDFLIVSLAKEQGQEIPVIENLVTFYAPYKPTIDE